MSTITKEQAKDLRNAFECWQQDYDPVEDKEQYDMFGLGMVAMDALLASLEAEPVAWISERNLKNLGKSYSVYVKHEPVMVRPIPLYTAPPAPVSVPGAATAIRACMEEFPESVHDIVEECAAIAENACRAAMLQGAEPVTTANRLPGDFASFISWLTSGDGIPDWLINGDKLDDEKVSFLLKVYRAGGNSPVIPDGWVMVPVEPTEEMSQAAFEAAGSPSYWYGFDELWEAAIAAVPQQERE